MKCAVWVDHCSLSVFVETDDESRAEPHVILAVTVGAAIQEL
jgi:hypothetical protein